MLPPALALPNLKSHAQGRHAFNLIIICRKIAENKP
jgi:hypothetical protein